MSVTLDNVAESLPLISAWGKAVEAEKFVQNKYLAAIFELANINPELCCATLRYADMVQEYAVLDGVAQAPARRARIKKLKTFIWPNETDREQFFEDNCPDFLK